MEEETIKQKENGHLLGIIGAIIGAIVGAIPWVLVYVYGNMMLSFLAIIIAAGGFYGYKLFKGKMDKSLPIILMIISIIVVSVATLLVIPLILIHNEGMQVSVDALKYIYSYGDFQSAIIRDFIVSIIFTVLGSSVITSNVKRQIQNGNGNIDLENSEQRKKQAEEAINLLKPIFKKYEAVSKEKTIMREEVVAEIDDSVKANQYFNYLKSVGVIKKSKGQFYYSEENEGKQEKTVKNNKIALVAIIVLAIITIVGVGLSDRKPSTNVVENADVKYSIGSNWNTYEDYTEDYIAYYGWDYYRYINTIPNTEQRAKELAENNEIDYEHEPAGINVYYTEMEEEFRINSIEELKNSIEETAKEGQTENYTIEEISTPKGYKGVLVTLKYEQDVKLVQYIYYLLNEDKLAIITVASYNFNDSQKLQEDAQVVVDSFEWK